METSFRIALDPTPQVLSVSDGVTALLGFAPADFIDGRVSLRQRIHADDHDLAERLFAPSPGTGPEVMNLRLRHADGRIRCMRAESSKTAAAPGAPLQLALRLQCARSLPRSPDDAALTANSHALRAMMTNADDYIYFKDRHHVFTGASQSLVSLCEPAEHWTDLLGATDYDVFPEPLADGYYRLEKMVFAGLPVARELQQTLGKDGRQGWVDNRKYPIRDAAGAIVGLYGIARDITEQVQAQAALRDSEKRYHSLYSSMIEGMALHELVLDAQGRPLDYRILDANPAFESHTGVHPQTVIGRLASEAYGVLPAPFLDLYARVALSGQPHVFDQFFPPLGKHFLISVFSPVRLQFVTVFEDITESKRLEQELRDSEQRFRQLLEHTPNIAVQGYDPQRRVIFWNQASEQLYGYSTDEALGRQLEDLIIPDAMREVVISATQAWMQGGPAIPAGELTLRHKNGSAVPVFSSHAMQVGRHGPEMFCLDIDLSARKQAEAELERHRLHLEDMVQERTRALAEAVGRVQRSEQHLRDALQAAEAATRAKSAFLANMSHEIRTPMNAILGLTTLIRRKSQGAEVNARLDKIAAAGRHLLAIIDDILDLSKIEAGKMLLDERPLRVESVVGDVVSMMHERARDKRLQLFSEVPPLPPGLVGDPTRLQQALLNYVSNAIKFTDAGSVAIRVAVVEASEQQVLLRFEVADTGIGIAPEALPRLFGSFEQGDNSTTRSHGGTGLGLAITRRIAQMMQGGAGVETTSGRGSRFWFTARLARRAEAAESDLLAQISHAEQRLLSEFAGLQVLVAEDEPVNREITVMMLEEVGLAVDLARDGLEAVAMASRHPYQLIVMDMQMPHLDGLGAARHIRALPRHRSTPIMAMTANVFSEDRARCLEAGMCGFISKPVMPEDLYQQILLALETAGDADADAGADPPPA